MTIILERGASAVTESFVVATRVMDALETFRSRSTVVRLGSIDNETLGVARWSTLADAWTAPGSRARARWSQNPVISVAPGDDPELVLATRTPVIVLGADNHAHAYAKAVIDGVRASCVAVLVVDMGSGAAGSDYADIVTSGFDRARGSALLELLTGESSQRPGDAER